MIKNHLIIFLLIFLCSFKNFAHADDASFSVGVALCLTGDCAEWGKNSLEGLQLAQKEINDAGGVLGKKIEFVTQDTDEGKGGAHSVSALKQLTLDKSIQYFIGPTWTSGGLPVAPIAAKMKIIMTSPSLGVAAFNETSDNLFNVWPHDEYSSLGAAKYAFDHNLKKGAILSSSHPWSKLQGDVIEKEVMRLGGTVVDKEEPLPNAAELKTESLRVFKSAPDVVFITDVTAMSEGAKELRRLGYKGQLVSILMDDTRLKAAQGALEGAVIVKYPEPTDEFSGRFQAMHNHKPGITADTAYDALQIYAKAITEAKTFDVDVVKKKILEIDYIGSSGKIVFDSKGGVKRDPAFYKVEGENLKRIAE